MHCIQLCQRLSYIGGMFENAVSHSPLERDRLSVKYLKWQKLWRFSTDRDALGSCLRTGAAWGKNVISWDFKNLGCLYANTTRGKGDRKGSCLRARK